MPEANVAILSSCGKIFEHLKDVFHTNYSAHDGLGMIFRILSYILFFDNDFWSKYWKKTAVYDVWNR
jgi:hypothetical protein